MKTLILKCKYTVNTCLKLWLLKEQNEFDLFFKRSIIDRPHPTTNKTGLLRRMVYCIFFLQLAHVYA